jgi:starch-binding outer membrane protein, SusD/RagB family
MKNSNKKIIACGLVIFMSILSSCTFDYVNPNAPTETQVLNSVDGLLNYSLGLRYRYSIGATGVLYNAVTVSGLATQELRVVNAGNADLAALDLGGTTVTNLNNTLNNLWLSINLLNGDCDRIIDKISVIGDKTLANYVQGHAHLFKALALGTMAQFWENGPINTTTFGTNAQFSTRADLLQKAVDLCSSAITLIGSDPQPAAFTAILGTSISIPNSLNALLARYNLMLENNQAAINASLLASRTVRSSFGFDAVAQNPLFRSSFVTNNITQPRTVMGLTGSLAPESGDGRVPFYLNTASPFSIATPGAVGFWSSDLISIPLYLPDEMSLIRAEAFARLNNLASATSELNVVRNQTTDLYGVNANLSNYSGPNTQQDLLNEIYKNRCIELFLTGTKLEDSRRFNRQGPGDTTPERNRNFYPYPFTERNNNPNTPTDPAN